MKTDKFIFDSDKKEILLRTETVIGVFHKKRRLM